MGFLFEPLTIREPPITPVILSAVNPIIHGAQQPVGLMFYISIFCVSAVNKRLTDRSVTFSFIKPQIRWFGDKQPAAHQTKRTWHHQRVQKNCSLVYPPSLVGVFQYHDSADRLIFSRAKRVGHIAIHLGYPHPALFIKHHRHRRNNKWLRSDKLDLKTFI